MHGVRSLPLSAGPQGNHLLVYRKPGNLVPSPPPFSSLFRQGVAAVLRLPAWPTTPLKSPAETCQGGRASQVALTDAAALVHRKGHRVSAKAPGSKAGETEAFQEGKPPRKEGMTLANRMPVWRKDDSGEWRYGVSFQPGPNMPQRVAKPSVKNFILQPEGSDAAMLLVSPICHASCLTAIYILGHPSNRWTHEPLQTTGALLFPHRMLDKRRL